jgi:hypothetical protein
MKSKWENRLNMFLTVQAVVGKNQSLWQPLKAFAAAVVELTDRINSINALSQSLNGGTKGVTAGKRQARHAMADAAEEAAGAVGAYASKKGDVELEAKVDYSASEILRVRDTLAANLCQAIHDTAKENLNALGTYGVTAKTLAALQTSIDSYRRSQSKPRTMRTDNRATQEQLTTEFAAIDKLLNEQLDRLMAKFKTTQPAFFTAYTAAREIVDNPGGHAGKSDENASDAENKQSQPTQQ